MRQTGYLAAAGIYALKNNVTRLCEDHIRAKKLEEILQNRKWIKQVLPTKTNIVIAILQPHLDEQKVVKFIETVGIRCIGFGKGRIRFVTHLDINDQDIKFVKNNLPKEVLK